MAEDPQQPAAREIVAVRDDTVAAVDRLRRSTSPPCASWGSPASSLGVARLLAKTLPSVTTVEIDGVGHMAPVTHPDRVNAVIASYLEDVTATG
jgi:pimeloyl-ACP methyl ester carboxylesterase